MKQDVVSEISRQAARSLAEQREEIIWSALEAVSPGIRVCYGSCTAREAAERVSEDMEIVSMGGGWEKLYWNGQPLVSFGPTIAEWDDGEMSSMMRFTIQYQVFHA